MFRIMFGLFFALAVFSSSTFAAKLDCGGPHEEYSCGSACQTTCENMGQPCLVVNIKCNDAQWDGSTFR
ncbi:venom metalloprotease inhibitor-like [Andrena cerasifolii]|uniref:venom metalloprotease inhibitor-like n=1 Tax=Andrena cerasifolii TaxID=2819439 RepID=UPI004038189F